ncbi:MAG: hypothetical protein ACPGJS_20080 [Flammeovirgaceae bacterium]
MTMTKEDIKRQMGTENIYAIQAVITEYGRKVYLLKGCYHCNALFIAQRRTALTCCDSCSTSISHKLTRGHNMTGQFKITKISREIDFDKYPMRT